MNALLVVVLLILWAGMPMGAAHAADLGASWGGAQDDPDGLKDR